ncbi:hypothetical protein Tco_1428761 [Tanacetum coccineum]
MIARGAPNWRILRFKKFADNWASLVAERFCFTHFDKYSSARCIYLSLLRRDGPHKIKCTLMSKISQTLDRVVEASHHVAKFCALDVDKCHISGCTKSHGILVDSRANRNNWNSEDLFSGVFGTVVSPWVLCRKL